MSSPRMNSPMICFYCYVLIPCCRNVLDAYDAKKYEVTLVISLAVSATCHLYTQKMQAKSLFYKNKKGIMNQLLNASHIYFYIYINFCLHLSVLVCPLWSNRMVRKKCHLGTAWACNKQHYLMSQGTGIHQILYELYAAECHTNILLWFSVLSNTIFVND